MEIALYGIGKGIPFAKTLRRREKQGLATVCDCCFAMTVVAVIFAVSFEDLFY
jgi:hypothetical protein